MASKIGLLGFGAISGDPSPAYPNVLRKPRIHAGLRRISRMGKGYRLATSSSRLLACFVISRQAAPTCPASTANEESEATSA